MVQQLLDDLRGYFEAKSPLTKQEQELMNRLNEGYFPITSIHRNDLAAKGFDVRGITDSDTNYIKKVGKRGKNIGACVLLMSVGDKSVNILFVVGYDSKSLPDELVCDSDHGKFTGLSVLPEPRVSLFALGIEPAGIPCSDIEESSGICVSVPVDVPSDVLLIQSYND